VDIRPLDQRQRDGELAGAVVVDRNVLEWRLDPTSPHRIAEATGADQEIVIVCNEGYGSSLAALSLQELGLVRATDLAGGFQGLLALQRGSGLGPPPRKRNSFGPKRPITHGELEGPIVNYSRGPASGDRRKGVVMGESWDWRRTYAEYAGTRHGEGSPQETEPAEPAGAAVVAPAAVAAQGPDATAPGVPTSAAPYGPPQPYAPPGSPPYGGPYAGPYPPYAGYPPPVVANRGRGFTIAAFICGGIGLLFFPLILGPLGIIFGFVGASRGDKLGRWAGLMSIATTMIGTALRIAAGAYLRSHLGG